MAPSHERPDFQALRVRSSGHYGMLGIFPGTAWLPRVAASLCRVKPGSTSECVLSQKKYLFPAAAFVWTNVSLCFRDRSQINTQPQRTRRHTKANRKKEDLERLHHRGHRERRERTSAANHDELLFPSCCFVSLEVRYLWLEICRYSPGKEEGRPERRP